VITFVAKIDGVCTVKYTNGLHFLAVVLLAASGDYSIGDWYLDGWMSVCHHFFFQIVTTTPWVFLWFAWKLAHM